VLHVSHFFSEEVRISKSGRMVAMMDGGILLLKGLWLGMEEHWNSFGSIAV